MDDVFFCNSNFGDRIFSRIFNRRVKYHPKRCQKWRSTRNRGRCQKWRSTLNLTSSVCFCTENGCYHWQNPSILNPHNNIGRVRASIIVALRCYILTNPGGLGPIEFRVKKISGEENFRRIKNHHPFPADSAHFCFHRGLKLKPVCISKMLWKPSELLWKWVENCRKVKESP